jgi:hypothetical protein
MTPASIVGLAAAAAAAAAAAVFVFAAAALDNVWTPPLKFVPLLCELLLPHRANGPQRELSSTKVVQISEIPT